MKVSQDYSGFGFTPIDMNTIIESSIGKKFMNSKGEVIGIVKSAKRVKTNHYIIEFELEVI